MELRVPQYFLAVTREQNISAAAEAPHLSQPTLSRQLKDIADDTGNRTKINAVKNNPALRLSIGKCSIMMRMLSSPKPLLLAARNIIAPLLDIGIVLFWHSFDKFIGTSKMTVFPVKMHLPFSLYDLSRTLLSKGSSCNAQN